MLHVFPQGNVHQSLPSIPDPSASASLGLAGSGASSNGSGVPANAATSATAKGSSTPSGGRVLQRLSSIRSNGRKMFTTQMSTSKSESHACSQATELGAEGMERRTELPKRVLNIFVLSQSLRPALNRQHLQRRYLLLRLRHLARLHR
jgi:hypothetical protein